MGNNKTNSHETPFHAGDDLTFRLMFESHPAIMLLIEPQSGVILDANPAALKFYGYPKLNGMLISDIDISPSEEGVLDQQKALSKPQTHFVFRQRLSSGAERRVEVNSSLLTVLGRQVLFLIIHDLTRLDPIQVGPDKKGRVLSDDETMQDELAQENMQIYLLELERQNNELRRSQVQLEGLRARYFNLYNLAPMGCVTLSEHGLILEANLSAAALLGESRDALVNQSFSRFILKGDADIFYLRCKALFETGAAQVCDLRLLKTNSPQGSAWVQLDLTFVQEADAKPVGCVTLCDISQRKLAEEELRESEGKYRLIGENTSDGIILFGADYRILYVSPAYLKQLGYSEAEELSRTPNMIKSIIHPDDGDVVFPKIFEAIRLNKSGLTYSYSRVVF
jgi:PAS domain S-box-containing protein